MKRLYVFAALILASCGEEPIQEPDWRLVASTKDDDPYCVDVNSTADSELFSDNKIAWVKLSRNDGSRENPSFVDVLSYAEFNCGERTVREHSWIKRRDDYTSSSDVTEEDQIDSTIVPDTIGATMYNTICHGDLTKLSPCPRDLLAEISQQQNDDDVKPQVSWEELSPTPPSSPFEDVFGPPPTPSEEASVTE